MDPEVILDLAAGAALKLDAQTVVIDCQVRPTRTQDILEPYGVDWIMFLMDCPDPTRNERLLARGWKPENLPQGETWQRVLKEESISMGIGIVDSGRLSVDQCCDAILDGLGDKAIP